MKSVEQLSNTYCNEGVLVQGAVARWFGPQIGEP